MKKRTLARGLGWFGIGLGILELLAPAPVSRAAGIPGRARLVRLFGLREIASGVGILAQRRRRRLAGWVWARVAGDVLDLAVLGSGLFGRGGRKLGAAIATANVAAVSAADVWCATSLDA